MTEKKDKVEGLLSNDNNQKIRKNYNKPELIIHKGLSEATGALNAASVV
jgi:hypothetical protein